MKLHLMPQFLNDLRTIEDPRFVRRTLNQIIDDQGSFKPGKDDHRYHGIENAWIRYISGGTTAYRLIFIQNGDDVHLYRAGQHSIEDKLTKPTGLDKSISVSTFAVSDAKKYTQYPAYDDGTLLKSKNEVLLSKTITALTHVGHKEIYLVSPFISDGVLDKFSPFGRFLDKMIEDGADVYLITAPPIQSKISYFQTLAERNINVYFYKNLHAKLYIFEIDQATLNQYTKDTTDTAILGSANLTDMGLAFSGTGGNEELCYRLPISKYTEAKDYVYWLVSHSEDLITYKSKEFRRF